MFRSLLSAVPYLVVTDEHRVFLPVCITRKPACSSAFCSLPIVERKPGLRPVMPGRPRGSEAVMVCPTPFPVLQRRQTLCYFSYFVSDGPYPMRYLQDDYEDCGLTKVSKEGSSPTLAKADQRRTARVAPCRI